MEFLGNEFVPERRHVRDTKKFLPKGLWVLCLVFFEVRCHFHRLHHAGVETRQRTRARQLVLSENDRSQTTFSRDAGKVSHQEARHFGPMTMSVDRITGRIEPKRRRQ